LGSGCFEFESVEVLGYGRVVENERRVVVDRSVFGSLCKIIEKEGSIDSGSHGWLVCETDGKEMKDRGFNKQALYGRLQVEKLQVSREYFEIALAWLVVGYLVARQTSESYVTIRSPKSGGSQ